MIKFKRTLILGTIISTVSFSTLSNAQVVDKGNFSTNQICKAGIATVMGRDPTIMRIDGVHGEITYLSYVRSQDQTEWRYKCKLDGNKIIWGMDSGRWRTHPMDSIITFHVKGDVLNIEELYLANVDGDRAITRKSFNLKQLGR